jgi:uncharacterized protein (TIGR00661 family)
MNILYGVQATGNGHINRSREIIAEMKSRGHSVLTVFSGRDPDKFWDIDSFFPYMILKGLTFQIKNGKIQYLTTLKKLDFFQFYKDVNMLSKKMNDFDVIVSDFEPITTRAARKAGVFCINLSHQACFYYHNIPTEKDFIGNYIAKNYANANLNIGIHWDQFDKRNIIVPPVVPNNLVDKMQPDKYLVYLPFENISRIVKSLSKISCCKFYVYHSDWFADLPHVFYRPFSREGFLNDLQESCGIISNAGFELISEALYLGRKIMVKAVKNQMEQESNAKSIEILGLGKSVKKITRKNIEEFIITQERSQLVYPKTQKIFTDWLEGQTFETKNLMQNCWR